MRSKLDGNGKFSGSSPCRGQKGRPGKLNVALCLKRLWKEEQKKGVRSQIASETDVKLTLRKVEWTFMSKERWEVHLPKGLERLI